MDTQKLHLNYNVNHHLIENSKKKYNIILDLDSTIIFCTCNINMDFDLLTSFKIDNYTVYIYSRPYLNEFLEFIKTYFNIYIYTNGNYEYSEIIVTHIKHKYNVFISEVICRINTTEQQDKFIENYSDKSINNNNTIIIDDIQDIWKFSLNNVINIKPFDLNHFYHNDDSINTEIDLFILKDCLKTFLNLNNLNKLNFSHEISLINKNYKNISKNSFIKYLDKFNKENGLLTDSDDSNNLYDSSDFILNKYYIGDVKI